jgi:hypothetical protein
MLAEDIASEAQEDNNTSDIAKCKHQTNLQHQSREGIQRIDKKLREDAQIYHIPALLSYLLIPCSRVLLEKLTGFAASQEIPRIYGTRKFITILTSPRQLSLSRARSIQSHNPLPLPEDPS